MTSRVLSTACLLYLLLPCLVFLAGWVQPWLAWPLGLGLSAAVLWVARECPARRIEWDTAAAFRLLGVLLLGALWVLSIGFDGVVAQSGDATVRNAIYEELVRGEWPLRVNGGAFVYYLGFWLPPALAAKCGADAGVTIQCWALAGVWLALLAVACGRGTRRALVFTVILLLLGDMMNWVNRFYFKLLEDSNWAVAREWTLFFDLHYTPSCVQLRNTFNHYLAPLVLLGMLTGNLLPARYNLAAGALVLICSPLAAVALLPLLLWRGGWRALNLPVVVVAAYAVLPLLYLAGGVGGQLAFMRPAGECSLAALSMGQLWLRYALQVALVAGPALLLLWRWRRTAWFCTALLLAVALPLLWVGLWNNEMIYKGSAVMWFCLAWLYATEWCHAAPGRKLLLALFVLASASDAYGQLMGSIKSLAFCRENRVRNIRNEWHGRLHQPLDFRASQFEGAPLLPQVFKF